MENRDVARKCEWQQLCERGPAGTAASMVYTGGEAIEDAWGNTKLQERLPSGPAAHVEHPVGTACMMKPFAHLWLRQAVTLTSGNTSMIQERRAVRLVVRLLAADQLDDSYSAYLRMWTLIGAQLAAPNRGTGKALGAATRNLRRAAPGPATSPSVTAITRSRQRAPAHRCEV